jgi:hypothetical protein
MLWFTSVTYSSECPRCSHYSFVMNDARIISMSNLLPNVDDLIVALPDTTQAADTRELTLAAATAETPEELDRALATVIEGWLA